jgi:GT2 family glycosyltransferase
MARVSVVVPVFNSIAHLPAFFSSLAAAIPDDAEVIVVDDASTQAVLETVPDMPRARSVTRVRNNVNLGNSGAVNRGLREVTGDIIVQLNADLVLDPDCIGAMVRTIVNGGDDIGIVGSKLVYPTSGRTQSVGMAFGFHSKRHVYRHLPVDHPLCRRTREVQIVTGATVAMTRRVLDRLGPLDEQLYNHNLDLDHCLHARSLGLRNVMCADSVAYHWRNRSGTVRYARVEAAEAAFWAKWGGRYEVDLGQFLDEALDHVFDGDPTLADTPFTVIDLTRGADQPIAIERLTARWPRLGNEIRPHRQMNNPSDRLWLPILLPAWQVEDPTPFIYLVDSHEELTENAMWFRRRRQVVTSELVVDLSATVISTDELEVGSSLGAAQ